MATSEKLRRRRRKQQRQQRIAELRERWAKSGPDELLDEVGACLYVGGSKPIDGATLWRRYSPPIKIGAQAVRWTRAQLDADRARANVGGCLIRKGAQGRAPFLFLNFHRWQKQWGCGMSFISPLQAAQSRSAPHGHDRASATVGAILQILADETASDAEKRHAAENLLRDEFHDVMRMTRDEMRLDD